MEFLWQHNRRFNAYVQYSKKTFGSRTQKISINAGFTCPNRDGTISYNGCSFCNNEAFIPSYCTTDKNIQQQINEGINFHRKRYKSATKYLAYFQAYSNTYKSVKKLENIYFEALEHPLISGLVIGTRPDCINDDILGLLETINKKYYVTVEYGIESCYNRTLKKVNRGHTFEQSIEAIKKTVSRKIRTGAHIIFGLPGETREEMLEEANILSRLPLNNIKFHQLQILKNTPMEQDFTEAPDTFKLFSLNEYIDFIICFLELLNPLFVVERLTANAPLDKLTHLQWGGIKHDQLLQMIEQRMETLNTWQGKFWRY